MDEVLYRGTRSLESIQMQTEIVASKTKDLLGSYAQQGQSLVLQVLNGEKCVQLKQNLLHLANYIVDLSKKVTNHVIKSNVLKELWISLKHGLEGKWSKREVTLICAGFFVGSLVGLAIGVALKRKHIMIRYMEAVQVTNYLGPEGVTIAEDAIAPFECGDHDVLINVKAASVQIIDAQICSGYGRNFRKILRSLYNESDLPVVLGRDCAGVITDLGRKVRRLEIGDEVWVTVPFWSQGTLSQTVLVSENRVAHKPKNVGFEGACSIPYAGSVALSVLNEASIDSSNTQNKKFLIQSGCTPVGFVLIQLLKYWKCNVTTTCYRRSVPVVEVLGVDDIIIFDDTQDYASNNFHIKQKNKQLVSELKRRGEHYDFIILTKDYRLNPKDLKEFCTENGRILITYPQKLLSDSGGFITRPFLTLFIALRLIIQDELAIPTDKYDEAHLCHVTLEKLTDLVEKGVLQTIVDKVFQPKDIEIALSHIQSPLSIGSTVITFR